MTFREIVEGARDPHYPFAARAVRVVALLDGIRGDDLDILGLFIERVRMGSETYGTLDIATDERDPAEEALFETIDQSYYLCWKIVKDMRRQESGES